jgi:ATP adenylyltransferase
MTYEALADFIRKGMRMSHIYQPAMLMTLLRGQGSCHEREIATAILQHDASQLEYYTKITSGMVGKVLRNRGVVERDRKSKVYSLLGFAGAHGDQLRRSGDQ